MYTVPQIPPLLAEFHSRAFHHCLLSHLWQQQHLQIVPTKKDTCIYSVCACSKHSLKIAPVKE